MRCQSTRSTEEKLVAGCGYVLCSTTQISLCLCTCSAAPCVFSFCVASCSAAPCLRIIPQETSASQFRTVRGRLLYAGWYIGATQVLKRAAAVCQKRAKRAAACMCSGAPAFVTGPTFPPKAPKASSGMHVLWSTSFRYCVHPSSCSTSCISLSVACAPALGTTTSLTRPYLRQCVLYALQHCGGI